MSKKIIIVVIVISVLVYARSVFVKKFLGEPVVAPSNSSGQLFDKNLNPYEGSYTNTFE